MRPKAIGQELLSRILLVVGLTAAGCVLLFFYMLFTQAYFYGAFFNGDRRLYVMATATKFFDDRRSAIDIVNDKKDVNFVFEAEEWDTFIGLVTKTKGAHSEGWRLAGSMVETNANNTRLFLLAGPGVRLVLRQGGDCVTYDIPLSDMTRFEQSLQRVKDHFAGTITGTGQSLDATQSFHATADTLKYWPPLPPALSNCG